MRNASHALVLGLVAISVFGCSLHKWAPLNEGTAGSTSEDTGGSGGDGGAESNGGSGGRTSTGTAGGTDSTGGTSSLDTSTSATVSPPTCATGFTGTDCAECLVVVNDDGGSDSNEGEAWGTALKTVQKGLDVGEARITANECTSAQVWVAKGTYYPTVVSDSADTTGRTKTVQLKENVALYGGFAGTETALSERNLANNVTTLSGDINTTGVATDNAYHVVSCTANCLLDGFTVTLGQADGASPHCDGGGMNNFGHSATIANCVFRANIASTSTVALARGGALFIEGGTSTISNCTFENNTATNSTAQGPAYGGALAINTAVVSVNGSTFDSNTASSTSMALGGAISSQNADSTNSTSLSNCAFTNNVATGLSEGSGGGIYITNATGVISSSLFAGNRAIVGASGTVSGGGAIALNAGPATISSCTIWGNDAGGTTSLGYGGGISDANGASVTILNSIIWGNTAATNPGADGTFVITYSDVQMTSGVYTGVGNINDDPMFNNTATNDFQLRSDSPCIDAGYGGTNTPATDLLGNARVDMSTVADTGQGSPTYVDMGAYEYQGS